LLRLVGPELGGRFRKEDARLRGIGRDLAELRDAEVMVTTFDELFDHFDHQLNPSVRRVRVKLKARMRSRERRLDAKSRLRRVERSLGALRARVERWAPSSGGWSAIADGLEGTYREARRAMRTAYRRDTAGAFHDWRKAVKYHDYHVRLLAEVWPEQME